MLQIIQMMPEKLEDISQAIEAATRALAEDKDIVLQENTMRGEADRNAFWHRYHDSNLHKQLQPIDIEARQAFDLLEQVRCEVLGARVMRGVAYNMAQSILLEVSDSPNKAEQMYLSLWSAMILPNNFPRYSIDDIVQKHSSLLTQALSSQTDFAEFGFHLLKDLGFDVEDLKPNENKNLPDYSSENLENETSSDENITGAGQLEASGAETSNIGTKDLSQQISSINNDISNTHEDEDKNEEEIPDYARQFTKEIGDDSYNIYTTQFDKIEHANKLSNPSELRELRKEMDILMASTQSMIGPFAAKLQRHILARQKHAFQQSYKSNLLDSKRLSRIVTNPQNPDCYQLKQDTSFKDTVLSLLIDNSGSMRGRPIMTAAISTEILARSLERCGIKTEILGFTTQYWKGGESFKRWKMSSGASPSGRMNDLLHIIYKSADMPWRKARLSMGLMLRDGLLKENIDGEALLWAYNRLRSMPEERKILMVISDGAPIDDATLSVNNSEFLEAHLHKVIHWLEAKKDIELLAIGIGHDVTRYYSKAVKLTDVNDLTKTLVDKMIELLV